MERMVTGIVFFLLLLLCVKIPRVQRRKKSQTQIFYQERVQQSIKTFWVNQQLTHFTLEGAQTYRDVRVLLQGSAPESEDFVSASETLRHVPTYLLRQDR